MGESQVSRRPAAVNQCGAGFCEVNMFGGGVGELTLKPLGMGEGVTVKTNDRENEWLEAREALQLKIPGEPVCRAR